MKRVLKFLGYREKSENAHKAIRDARLLNSEVKNRIERVRATLNGEEFWFKRRDEDECDCK